MSQYGTLITRIGLAKIANAQVTQSTVGLEYIALGDGNGAHYVPTQDQTGLINEVWRGPIANLSIDPNNSNRIIADAVIPNTAGGFTIREIGLFDEDNHLIAVGQYPATYKPLLNEGISEELLIHFTIETANAEVVELAIDPTVIIASRSYVDMKVDEVRGELENIGEQVEPVRDDLAAHLADYMPHDSDLSQFAFDKDLNGIYTVVEFKRSDNTLYLKSALSNEDEYGNYQTVTWDFFDETGAIIKLTKSWTLTYDVDGMIESKVIA